ncbi:MAG: methylase [Methylocystaceae bacterium]|nr:MAG: methylase [Methylocystaceae bacterium]
MTMTAPSSAAKAAAPSRTPMAFASRIVEAAQRLLPGLEQGHAVDAHVLRAAMEQAFGGSDAEGVWTWKDAYEACETAQILFLHKFGRAMRAQARSDAAMLSMVEKIAKLLPTHTRRTQESDTLQQFSTPIPLGLVARIAAAVTPADVVLEPSAGTGMLAVFVELAGARLALNEIAETRAALLSLLFPDAPLTRHDAASLHDRLDDGVRPSVILMNSPFTAMLDVDHAVGDTAFRHVSSALARLTPGGRLVAITGARLSPDDPAAKPLFARFQEKGGHIRFSCAIDGAVYAKQGTSIETRLTVIDKLAAPPPNFLPPSDSPARSAAELLSRVLEGVPARSEPSEAIGVAAATLLAFATAQPVARERRSVVHPASDAVELVYEPIDRKPVESGVLTDALYEGYALQSIRIPGAEPHPTKLVQSAAMAPVAPPNPTYRPHLPARVIEHGLLSDAQLESVIYAGEAHCRHLAGRWIVDETGDNIHAAANEDDNAMRFRRGWFLGDGTGCGKGRQVAGVLLDNWFKGRRRALWISKSDKLIEDAQRDWSALGQERLLIQPLARFRQGTPIKLHEGVLFCTYATLRSAEREGKASRLRQIVDWLGRDFDGVIVFDEAHALANAGGGTGERGEVAPSQQGRAGLRLQRALPDARIVYVSATGATAVRNLAYAQRLGLWGGEDFPFANRAEFVQAVEAGGVAAMEILARDLQALGLYMARSLSYEGVEVELVEHRLTPAQTMIYDAYSRAFQVIHNNLSAALEASNITSSSGTLNGRARTAARSAFESAKQRFFNHLITSMKTPTLIASVERDLDAGHAAVAQFVSTGEAVMERRLSEIPAEEWSDLSIDLSPREYVLSYLQHSFPTQLFEPFTDDEGNLSSRPAFDESGNPVQCREAVERRDRMIEQLAALDAVPGALDQIVQHFGADRVAEVTGRSRRIVRKNERLCVENRPASANLAETQAFMDDEKRILVFSDAGGTGRSYHADMGAKNKRLRVHYLLEAGWKADAAIQGLGRSNRTNQAQPPLFRPIATDVKAEKRFLSTIARRLDTLGAITRGQRQTGGQGLFRAEDNLEGPQARAALRQFYMLLYRGGVEGCSLQDFEEATGLSLADRDGSLREELPPITTFLNRLLALQISLQNAIFTAFEELLDARIEAALAAGVYDVGLETIAAESLTITERRTVWRHPESGAETQLLTLARKDRNKPLTLTEALDVRDGVLMVNARSGRAAVRTPAPSLMLDDGAIERRVRLIRPMERSSLSLDALAQTEWAGADLNSFARAWQVEVSEIPEFTTSALHLVTGLLLPIWRRLPDENCRVYRLQTDDGERVTGRMLSSAEAETACRNLGVDAPKISADDAWSALSGGGSILHLSDGLSLRRVRIMHECRIELIGFTSGMVESLKARGLIAEIISWRLRLFVPTGERGREIFDSLLDRWPLVEIAQKG